MADKIELKFMVDETIPDLFCAHMNLTDPEGIKSNAQLMWDHIANEWLDVAIYRAGEEATHTITGTSTTLSDKMEAAKETAEDEARETLEITGRTVAMEII